VEDLKATLEKLLTDAEDCALIGKLATDEKKRELLIDWPLTFAPWHAMLKQQ
jgi:hypothetical protein